MDYNLKVGFVLLHPFSDSLASAVRVINLANSLAKKGVKSVIFTPYEVSRRYDEMIEIIQVPSKSRLLSLPRSMLYRFSRKIYYSNQFQKISLRLLEKGSYIFDFEKSLKKTPVDILLAEQDNAALLCCDVANRFKIPFLIDLHGIWPEELVASGVLSYESNEFQKLQERLNDLFLQSDSVIALGKAMKDYMLENYDIDKNKIIIVPPGSTVRSVDFQERLYNQRIIYAGTVMRRKKIELYIHSIPLIQKVFPEVECYITDKGDLISLVKRIAKKIKANMKYYWFPKHEDLFKFLSTCNVGVLPAQNDIATRISMPSKLFDYWSVSLPVVSNNIGGWTQIIQEYGAGKITDETPECFAEAICSLLEDPTMAMKMGKSGAQLIQEKYNWDNSAEILLNNLKNI